MSIEDRYEYNSIDVARYIAAYANEHKFGINITKIQKLLYAAYGVFLSVNGYRLTDEHPAAWPYGPVFASTRERIKGENLPSLSFDNQNIGYLRQDKMISQLMNLIFNTYGALDASSLTAWSHEDGSPWELTTRDYNFKWGDAIPDVYIKDHFDKIVTVGNG